MWCVPRGVQSFTCLPTVCPPVEGSAPPTLLTAMETNYAEAVARGGEAGLSHCHWSVTLSLVPPLSVRGVYCSLYWTSPGAGRLITGGLLQPGWQPSETTPVTGGSTLGVIPLAARDSGEA